MSNSQELSNIHEVLEDETKKLKSFNIDNITILTPIAVTMLGVMIIFRAFYMSRLFSIRYGKESRKDPASLSYEQPISVFNWLVMCFERTVLLLNLVDLMFFVILGSLTFDDLFLCRYSKVLYELWVMIESNVTPKQPLPPNLYQIILICYLAKVLLASVFFFSHFTIRKRMCESEVVRETHISILFLALIYLGTSVTGRADLSYWRQLTSENHSFSPPYFSLYMVLGFLFNCAVVTVEWIVEESMSKPK